MPGLSVPGTFESFFGDVGDSDLNMASSQWSLLSADRSCRTVTIAGSRGLISNNWRLFCHRLVIDSTASVVPADGMIQCNGGDANSVIAGNAVPSGFFGGGGNGGAGGVASANVGTDAGNGGLPAGTSLGGAGGDGGVGLSGANGRGGNPAQLAAAFRRMSFFTGLTGMFTTPTGLAVPAGGAGGGGGGRRDGGTQLNGGGGGAGGGIVFVAAGEIVLLGSNPHFAVRGGDGGGATAGLGAGGGGGGGGGAIILVFGRMVGQLVTNVAGGLGGSGTNPGKPGANGNLFLYQL